MTLINRRAFALGAVGFGALGACANGVGSNGAAKIDARVDVTLAEMLRRYPGTQNLVDNANGMLVMPLITEVGFGFGGGYGRGALRIGRTTVDYYSSTSASTGLQIGASQYSSVLFFMTQDALQDFRRSDGWAASANIEYAISSQGDELKAETTTSLAPVIAVVFGQAGFRVGATLEGIKYSRIIP